MYNPLLCYSFCYLKINILKEFAKDHGILDAFLNNSNNKSNKSNIFT